jgi:Papain family cysteine protease
MPDSIGPHLLGRYPRPPDDRDYMMASFAAAQTPLDQAFALLQASRTSKATKQWAAEVMKLLEPANPPPAPPAPTTARLWNVKARLDQGNTGHCVGFGWAGWGDTAPVEDVYANADGHAIYYECKVIDGEPGAENGSDVRSGAKAMAARGRLQTYVFAETVDDVLDWVLNHGPVVWGTNWTTSMFTPDAQGFVEPTGPVEGGHCWGQIGYDSVAKVATCLNSWGKGWGKGGLFHVRRGDLESLFADQGDVCAAAEIG